MEAGALRIRMEGGLEAIEAAGRDAHHLARRLRHATGPLSWLWMDRLGLADRVRDFARDQARVDEATVRLQRLGAAEGWPGDREPHCLDDLRRARARLAEAAMRACQRLGGSPSGALVEDLARVEAQLRGGPSPAVVDAVPVTVEPVDPNAPYTVQWKDFRARRRTGALLNFVGPLWIAALASSVSPVAAPAFAGWLVANYFWANWMGRFLCPRCRRPFSENNPLAPARCEHCGLQRFEGDEPWRRLKA